MRPSDYPQKITTAPLSQGQLRRALFLVSKGDELGWVKLFSGLDRSVLCGGKDADSKNFRGYDGRSEPVALHLKKKKKGGGCRTEEYVLRWGNSPGLRICGTRDGDSGSCKNYTLKKDSQKTCNQAREDAASGDTTAPPHLI